MAIPTTMTHLNKLILVQIYRSRKAELEDYMLNLIDCRRQNIDNYALTHTYDETVTYSNETNQINDYVHNTVIPSCTCMKTRKRLIEKLSKGKK
jgi:hypothetical protein